MSDTPAVNLTKRQRDVLRVLARHGQQRPGAVATPAFIRTTSPRETAASHLINLTKKGLAERHGTRMYPEWCITDAGVRALLDALKEEGEGGAAWIR